MNDDVKGILDGIRADRGYVMAMHETLGAIDSRLLRAYEDLYQAAMGKEAALPARERELIVMALDIVSGQSEAAVAGHARRAIAAGATREELGNVIELAGLVTLGKALGVGTAGLRRLHAQEDEARADAS